MALLRIYNICMIYDEHGNVLVQDRVKGDWKGISFPGGKVEPYETIYESTVREMKEETGLVVTNLELCGVKEWNDVVTGERGIVFHYKTNTFQGQLIEKTDEGCVFWIKLDDRDKYILVPDFNKALILFLKNSEQSQHFSHIIGNWRLEYYSL